MTESQWLASDDPPAMLAFLQTVRPSARKHRLLAAGCCRRIAKWVTDDGARHTVEVVERHADGLASDPELTEAHAVALEARDARHACERVMRRVYQAVADAADPSAVEAARWCPESIIKAGEGQACEQSRATEVRLIRCVFGNPFHAVAVDPAWLTPAVVAMARHVYEERAFELLPLLGDTLWKVGCQDASVLGHCRSEGPHCRGCWVVDLLLGKE